MSQPRPTNDVNLYLAALNSAMAVGLRSRSRILEEAGEHLHEAKAAERETMLTQAERRALPAEPEEAL